MNDVDLLGPPRSCRRMPLAFWLVWLAALAVLVVGAIAWEALT